MDFGTYVKRLLFLLPLLMLSTLVQAVEVTNLYQAEVQVETRTRAERQSKINEALVQTLVKLTGEAQIESDPRLKGMLTNPTRYVTQFGYQGEPLMLQYSFDASLLLKEMQARQLPIWGKQRPLTLSWIAIEDEEAERQLLSEQGDPQRLQRWQQQAGLRGLPLSLPLMDLEDAINVGINDVWGFFVDPVALASERYPADFFMLAQVWPDEEGWQYNLALYPYQASQSQDRYGYASVRRSVMQKNGRAASLDDGLEALQQELARYFARRYATVASGEQEQQTLVFEIRGEMSELVAVERYLKGLSAVSNVKVSALQGRQVSFSLEVVGSEQALEEMLNLEPKVERLPVDDDLVNQVRYRWLGDQ